MVLEYVDNIHNETDNNNNNRYVCILFVCTSNSKITRLALLIINNVYLIEFLNCFSKNTKFYKYDNHF